MSARASGGPAATRRGERPKDSAARRRRASAHPCPTAPQSTALLSVRSRQRTRKVNRQRLRKLVASLLADRCPGGPHALGVHLVDAREMARLNEFYLQHAGSTDVITFDHNNPPTGSAARPPAALFGEIFICIDEAVAQARRYRSTWPSELARYVIHGLLHLLGYDDRRAAARRVMKREEDRWLRAVARRFPLSTLAKDTKLRA